MNSELVKYYSDECPQCESWEVRVTDSEYNEENQGWDITVCCRSCGFEWEDYIEDS